MTTREQHILNETDKTLEQTQQCLVDMFYVINTSDERVGKQLDALVVVTLDGEPVTDREEKREIILKKTVKSCVEAIGASRILIKEVVETSKDRLNPTFSAN